MKIKGKQLLSCALVVVSCAVSFGAGYVVGNYDKYESKGVTLDSLESQESFFVEGSDLNRGMKLMIADAVSTETNVTTTSSETVKTVTATFTPSYAVAPKIVFSLAWENASSEWATGKTVTDYVKIVDEDPNDLTAELQCLKAFGELITLKCSIADNTTVYDTATLHYLQRVEDFSFFIGSQDSFDKLSYNTAFNYKTKYDDYNEFRYLDNRDKGSHSVLLGRLHKEGIVSECVVDYCVNAYSYFSSRDNDIYTDSILDYVKILPSESWYNYVIANKSRLSFNPFPDGRVEQVYSFNKDTRKFELEGKNYLLSGYGFHFSFMISGSDSVGLSDEQFFLNFIDAFSLYKTYSNNAIWTIPIVVEYGLCNPFTNESKYFTLFYDLDQDSIEIPASAVDLNQSDIVF